MTEGDSRGGISCRENDMYQQISHVETELCRYRKGSLSLHIDLDRGLLRWKDSNQWNNDFTRSLSGTELQRIRDGLETLGVMDWPTEAEAEDVRHCRCSWMVAIDIGTERHLHGGSDTFPPQWSEFRDLIESVARTPFSL